MPQPAFPLVDVADIVRLVGTGSFSRAQAYSRNGAVATLEWDPAAGVLSGVVQGTSARPYRCSIDLAPATGVYRRPVDSRCTCPMDFDCKHVAATLLSSNAAHIQLEHAASQPARALTAPGPDAMPTWKSALGALGEPGEASASLPPGPWMVDPYTPAPPSVPRPMALQFELREEIPRSPSRWRGRAGRPAGATASGSRGHRLGVRPVMRNSKGNWVKAELTWNNLVHQVNRRNLDADHHLWFCQFAALHRAIRETYYGQDADWLYLDDFQSPLLWQLFADARRLGIEFLGSNKNAVVEFGTRADVSLDASASNGGDLTLTATVAIDGTPHPPEHSAAIGRHGVYSYEPPPRHRYTLAPSAALLTEEQRGLLGRPAAVVVPATDIDEFMAEFYPRLRQAVPVTSTDASIQFPEVVAPVLVLTATFLPKHTLELAWHWEYREGTTILRKPLQSFGEDDRPVSGQQVVGRPVPGQQVSGRPASGDSSYRDEPAEHDVLQRAADAGAVLEPATLRGLDAAEFADRMLPRLEELDGVRVDIVGTRPDYRELTEPPKLTIRTVETDQRDWFDLGVIVTVGGHDIPFGPLFKALAKGRDKLLLVDGSYLSLKQPEFEQLHLLIAEARALDEWDTGLRISRYQASLWADFEDLAEETEQAQSWRATARGLLELEAIEPTPLPATVQANLRPYQLDGFGWLAFLWKHQLGGILADDMGLGKTLQALALMVHAKEDAREGAGDGQPFLVVAPTSVVSNWLIEAARFAPGLEVRGITTTQAKGARTLADAVAGADVIVTSYTLFRLDFEAYQAEEWGALVLDEAQFVKNHTARVHVCARELNAPFKLAITGTPMENNLTELWSLFAIVAPGLFPSARKFTEDYVRPIDRGEAELRAELLARLRRRIRPLMMRRTKELVATELPAKQEQVLNIELEPRHKKLYETFLQRERQKLLGLIDDLDKNRFIIFRSLTLLRMLSLDASLVDEKYASVPSSKLNALFEQLEEVVAEGHRALIFSQFTSFLKKAAARLDEQGIPYAYLDGSTRHRAKVIASFKDGTAPVFLISLKAGGFGLNLTEADYVFLLDPWWNPATEAQAVDRTHRIGQRKNVMVYRMVATGTIEEKVMALKERKAKLFSSVMDDDAVFSSALTAEDIRGLFEST